MRTHFQNLAQCPWFCFTKTPSTESMGLPCKSWELLSRLCRQPLVFPFQYPLSLCCQFPPPQLIVPLPRAPSLPLLSPSSPISTPPGPQPCHCFPSPSTWMPQPSEEQGSSCSHWGSRPTPGHPQPRIWLLLGAYDSIKHLEHPSQCEVEIHPCCWRCF